MGWWDQTPSQAESGQRRLVRLKLARRSRRTHDAAILGVALTCKFIQAQGAEGNKYRGASAGSRLIKSKE